MTSKLTSKSVWSQLKVWAAKNAPNFLYVTIPDERGATHQKLLSVKPGESYFRVRLIHLSLEGSGSPNINFYPALHSSLRLRYGGHGLVNLSRVVTTMEVANETHLPLSGLMPYIGGKVELAAGVLALPRDERLFSETALRAFSSLTQANEPTSNLASEIFEATSRVEGGVKALLDLVGGRVHLGLYHPLAGTKPPSPGYIAAIITRGQLAYERLFVREERLYYRPEGSFIERPLEGFDYMLFCVEGRETRNDWRIKSIQDPLKKAVHALAGGRRDEAETYRILSVTAAWQSPDLTVPDQRRVALAVNNHLVTLKPSRLSSPVRATDLNRIMGTQTVSLQEARLISSPTLAEMLSQATPLRVTGRDILVWGGGLDAKRKRGYKGTGTKKKRPYRAAEGIGEAPSGGSGEPSVVPETTTTLLRQFNSWIEQRTGASQKTPLMVGESYTLCFNVGFPKIESLIDAADAVITESEIPDEGLQTSWFVSSQNVELSVFPGSEEEVKAEKVSLTSRWKAEFSLFIPKDAQSITRSLRVTPRATQDASISIIILARGTLYRQFDFKLKVVEARPEDPVDNEEGALRLSFAAEPVQGRFTGLTPPHEWETPPGELLLDVEGQGRSKLIGVAVDPTTKQVGRIWEPTDWVAALTDEAGPIRNLLTAAEDFREKFSDELNDIDASDLEARLSDLKNNTSRLFADDLSDQAHRHAWDEKFAKSDELRKLAIRGYTLYETLFPASSSLRPWLDSLHPGWRINIVWQAERDPTRPAHMPWGLLYTSPLTQGERPDPLKFWGLRFRVELITKVFSGAKPPALGGLSETAPAYGFYWGKGANDREIVDEVVWQRAEWSKWSERVFIPDETLSDPPKDQLTSILTKPRDVPLPVVYFFCQCAANSNKEPVLRFADTNEREDNIEITDLGQTEFENQPLVFVNACTSGSADPLFANELVSHFFRRKCRSYLGTEIKIPIRLASRFAKIFYSFFYRDISPEPMAAGEAVFQARLFLWRNYRNVGGLLYNYINQYNLYMATPEEVAQMPLHQ